MDFKWEFVYTINNEVLFSRRLFIYLQCLLPWPLQILTITEYMKLYMETSPLYSSSRNIQSIIKQKSLATECCKGFPWVTDGIRTHDIQNHNLTL